AVAASVVVDLEVAAALAVEVSEVLAVAASAVVEPAEGGKLGLAVKERNNEEISFDGCGGIAASGTGAGGFYSHSKSRCPQCTSKSIFNLSDSNRHNDGFGYGGRRSI